MENVIIVNQDKVNEFKDAVREAGADKFHVLSDFDRTLTKAFVDGEKISSMISILRKEEHLTNDYPEKAHTLFDKYHPIEIDPNISLAKKKVEMEKWWTEHFELLIKSGLNKRDLQKVVDSRKIGLREGFGMFADLLQKQNIPLVIMSASGLGSDPISMFLKREDNLFDNVHIISNSYEWDEKGNATGVKEPIIHVFNKDETAIQGFPAFNTIKDRKNVLLLGDSLGDIGMAEGFDYDNLLKIGFLNYKVEENLEAYKEKYDVLLLNDASLDFVNDLLKKVA